MSIEAPPQEKEESFSTVIPQEFHDRPYLKDFLGMKKGPEAYTALFKKLDGAETLIGKKTGIPAADAKPEEWEQFHAKLRPESADAYEFQTKEGTTPDPEFVKMLKSAFYEAGLTKAQAAKMKAKFEASIEARQAEQIKAVQKMDADFEALSKATFGAENDKAREVARTMLEEHTPAALRPYLGKLPNESLVILTGVLAAVHAKYGKEDTVPKDGKTIPPDATALREEGRKLMASPEYKDSFHPNHDKVVARVNEIYGTKK